MLAPTGVGSGKLRAAAVTSEGRRAVLVLGANLVFFRRHQEVPLPTLPWPPTTAGLLGNHPFVVVDPFRRFTSSAPTGERPSKRPRILRLSGRRWVTLLDAGEDLASGAGDGEMAQRLASHVIVAPGSGSQIWIADQYRYRLRRLSDTGKILELVEIPEASEAGTVGEASEAMGALRDELEKQGVALEGITVHAVTQSPKLTGALEGPDGRLYLFLPNGGDGRPALDRWDSTLGRLERLPLALDYEGIVSMAATADQLVLAGFPASQGPWAISWDRLAGAAWTVVDGAYLNGAPLSPVTDGPPQPEP